MMHTQTEFERPNPRHNSLRFGKGNEGLQPMQSETPIADWLVNWGWLCLFLPGLAMVIAAQVIP
jgi:hypothetical protein